MLTFPGSLTRYSRADVPAQACTVHHAACHTADIAVSTQAQATRYLSKPPCLHVLGGLLMYLVACACVVQDALVSPHTLPHR